MNEKVSKKTNIFNLFPNTFWKMKSVSSMVILKVFTNTTCENRLYYATFRSSRLQKGLKYGGNVKKHAFFSHFSRWKNQRFLSHDLWSVCELIDDPLQHRKFFFPRIFCTLKFSSNLFLYSLEKSVVFFLPFQWELKDRSTKCFNPISK